MHKLDHIVFGASSLEEGTNFIERKLGIKLSDIGYHDFMGTHNRVIKIDKDIYLEVIAINPASQAPNINRWFNLDSSKLQKQLKKSPHVIGYVIETNDKEITKHYSTPIKASRESYKWEFSMPNIESKLFEEDLIINGIIPSLITWESPKPILQMKDNQLSLNGFQVQITEDQLSYQKLVKFIGSSQKITILTQNKFFNIKHDEYPKIEISIKDNNTNKIITL